MRLSISLVLFALASPLLQADFVSYIWNSGDLRTIPVPPQSQRYVPAHINDSGVVVAGSSGPITWNGSAFQQYAIPTGYSEASGYVVTNAGVIGGDVVNGSLRSGALWRPDGSIQVIGSPAGSTFSPLFDINASNVVVGNYSDSQFRSHPYVWNSGNFLLLDGLASYPQTAGTHINDVGLVIGNVAEPSTSTSRAVYWSAGSTTPNLLPCSSSYSNATGVNNAGQIVGNCGSNAVLWDSSGNLTILGPGAASAINELGQVVGDTFSNQPFIWSAATGLELITAYNGQAGFKPGYAYDINNRGDVLLYGVVDIPEPANAALVAGGILFFAMSLLRKRWAAAR